MSRNPSGISFVGAAGAGRAGARQGSLMGAIFNVFPLILIPVLIYSIWAYAGGDGYRVRAHLEQRMFCIPMAASAEQVPVTIDDPCTDAVEGEGLATPQRQTGSQADEQTPTREQPVRWLVTFGDLMVLLALLLLFIELVKSTATGTPAIFNHALSMLVFIICLIQFLLHPAFATSSFFTIMTMSLLDVLAGVVVTIISARRDVEFAGQ